MATISVNKTFDGTNMAQSATWAGARASLTGNISGSSFVAADFNPAPVFNIGRHHSSIPLLDIPYGSTITAAELVFNKSGNINVSVSPYSKSGFLSK